MKTKTTGLLLLTALVAGIFGFSACAFATSHGQPGDAMTHDDTMKPDAMKKDAPMKHDGMTHHGMMMGKGRMMGGGMMMGGMAHDGLTPEQIAGLKAAKEKFQMETRDLKHQIKVKGLELQAALAKTRPDSRMAQNIQKEMSALKAMLDRKHVEHFINDIKKINPYAMFMGGPIGKKKGMGKGKMGMGMMKGMGMGMKKGMGKKPCPMMDGGMTKKK
ncbi:putative Zinc resistance-associated protein [Candidatus Desulfarcum epimagneticum]|uniref:Putative Zinc resistance-associated protein n=1 Tax=uncultured Desulfobacteraceae bacterium TaxID=218296 RepID=A0A484HJ19_9BACT|nr:putative Zinc resistance-associated protein [uncultured Desulfobacteraceae bacterium]